MLKKILFTICVATISAGAFAQNVSFGLKGGINFSDQSNSGSNAFNSSSKTGFQVGTVADIAIHQFSIQPGLYFITKGYGFNPIVPLYYNGSQNGTSTTKATVNLNYLELPVNLLYRIKFAPGMNLYFGAGAYLGYGLSGKIKASYGGSSSETNISFGSGGSDRYKNPDYGVNFIVGQRIKHIFLDVNYSLGLANLAEDDQYYKFHNRSLGLSVGYWFN